MTYPPPGGENPQYQLQPEPQQPSDPYAQGYNTPPPPTNYYQQQPGYSQPQMQPPPQYTQPGPPPPVGVQPGYPTAPGSVLPPPIPPAKQGGNLGVILAVVVGLVVVLGVAAVLLIPKLTGDDDDPQAGGGDDPTSESEPSDEPSEEPTQEATEEPTEGGDTGGGGWDSWGTPVSSDGDYTYDLTTPEGVALAYQVAQDTGDDATLESLCAADMTEDMAWDLQYEIDDTTAPGSYPFFAMSREVSGTVQAWAGYTWSDGPPASADDVIGGYTYTLVEENGEWKLYDLEYGLME
ncbi:hypothetical protein GCM10009853_023970 [Glycomyces scopariae]|uniref:Uncharacterized protein n=1 Tax=Glycomyces sambucus TaxID=380244 RepID=A0A1G9J2C6_9ACTN|nr:hypothetical protein [Glycomyces sambucus]SDL31462.1 hypothetical protein SAMN05216298_3366 [Glycomyces sambucus]